MGPPRDRGGEFILMIQVSGCSLFKFCQPPGSWAFSGDFTTNLARQCRAFSRALKIEKLKAPLFRGPEGGGATNDLCIMGQNIYLTSRRSSYILSSPEPQGSLGDLIHVV